MKHQILRVRLQQNVGIAWVKEKLTQMQQKQTNLAVKIHKQVIWKTDFLASSSLQILITHSSWIQIVST